MNRILAKLEGFIDNPDFILEKYYAKMMKTLTI